MSDGSRSERHLFELHHLLIPLDDRGGHDLRQIGGEGNTLRGADITLRLYPGPLQVQPLLFQRVQVILLLLKLGKPGSASTYRTITSA